MYEIFQLQRCILNQFICGRVIQLLVESNTVSFLVVRSFGGNSSRREVNESVGFTVLMTEGSGRGVVTPNPPSHRYIELSSFFSLCLTQVDDRSPCRLHPSSPVRNPTHLPLCFLMQMMVIPPAIMEGFLCIHTDVHEFTCAHTHTPVHLHTLCILKSHAFMHNKIIVYRDEWVDI